MTGRRLFFKIRRRRPNLTKLTDNRPVNPILFTFFDLARRSAKLEAGGGNSTSAKAASGRSNNDAHLSRCVFVGLSDASWLAGWQAVDQRASA